MLVLSLLATSLLCAQNFEKTLTRANTDFNHYSVETTAGGDMLFAGTLFEPGNNKIHVFKMDPNGNVLCEQTLDLSSDDRALDVTEDPNQRIVVTGYTMVNGLPELIVARFNSACACEQNTIASGYPVSAGTNIIWSGASQSYIVGGMRADQFTNPLYDNYAIVLEFDANLTMGNVRELRGVEHHHASVNDIIEMPNGYFITGSIDDEIGIQGVLAAWLDLNLNVTNTLSFESTNSQHEGVSSVYDSGTDKLYIMSNNSAFHNPQITTISSASTMSAAITGNYYLGLDPNFGPANASGFELKQSIYNPNNLVAAGYFRTGGGAPYTNAAPWLAEFQKATGTNVQTVVNSAPSPNFHAHGGGMFSTFAGVHPYIFSQEILTIRPDGAGYVYVGPRTVGGNYGLEVISTDFNHVSNDCLDPLSWSPGPISEQPITTYNSPGFMTQSSQSFSCSAAPSTTAELCAISPPPAPCVSQNFQHTVSQFSTDHNHYSIETSSFCGYVVAGTEFRNGNNDIHVFKMDDSGNMVWERYIDLSADDRALDILEDANGDLVVVGYTTVSGQIQMYIAKLNGNGNCIDDRVVNGFGGSAFTNVIYSSVNNTYVVGGMRTTSFNYPYTNNRAVVMQFDLNLNYTGIMAEFSGNDEQQASINDIVELPNGFYVTGSHDWDDGGTIRQGVLSAFLDFNLNITSNHSFQSTNHQHVGVSAVYSSTSDELYLMSNNSIIHNPQITIYGDIFGGNPVVVGGYYLELDPTYGSHDAAGFELRESVFNSGRLAMGGYFKTGYPTVSSFNATAWVVEFDKYTGTLFNALLYDPVSTNFHAHGNNVFSTFDGEHPHIFNQELLTYRSDGNGYVFLAPRLLNSNFAVDVVSTDLNSGTSNCFTNVKSDPISRSNIGIPTFSSTSAVSATAQGIPCSNANSNLSMECNVFSKQEHQEHVAIADMNSLEVYPNPVSDVMSVRLPAEVATGGGLTVLNALGETVSVVEGMSDQTTTLDLTDQTAGLYFVIYTTGDQQIMGKVMKR